MTWIITPEWTPLLMVIYTTVFLACLGSGIVEKKGLMSIQYSKFKTEAGGMSSRTGMFIIYFVPFLVHLPAVLLFVQEPLTTVQMIISACILIHFAKRSFESLFVHKYSGLIGVSTVMQICAGYSSVSIFSAYIYSGAQPSPDILVLTGVVLFIIGQFGNFYHHKLLADLRETEAGYFIPKGALFEKVTCPHYFFEVMAWVGIAFISRQIEMYLLALMMGSYLTGRSVKATEWYAEKFPDYPKSRKNIIPYLY